MKNMLFTRRAWESECRCSRWHLEEYNQHGVRRCCWWHQNWCRPFENHDSSPNFFCEKSLPEVEISFQVTSFLSSFVKCHWWRQNWSISFSFLCQIFCLCLQSLLMVALEFVSLLNIIFFCFFSVIWESSINQKAEENPLFLWRELSSGTSNAVTAEFSSCFYILDEVSKMNFLVSWNRNGTVDPFLMSISGEEKEKIVLLFLSRNEKGKDIVEAHWKWCK